MTNKAKEKEHTVEPFLKDTSEIRTQTLLLEQEHLTSFGPKGVQGSTAVVKAVAT